MNRLKNSLYYRKKLYLFIHAGNKIINENNDFKLKFYSYK